MAKSNGCKDHFWKEKGCKDCEIAGLREQLKIVQSHAKIAMDKLPERWNMGFQAGLKQAIPYEKELIEALAAEKKSRKDDNAALTVYNLKLEEENAALRQFIQDLCNEFMDFDGDHGKFKGSHLSEVANRVLGI